MPNSQFYHTELLPANLNLLKAQEVLENHFSGQILIGVDEAGRGPMAGPVVAGAAILVPSTPLIEGKNLLNDSKKLSEKQREKIFEELPNYCSAYSIGEASAQEIDEIGILNATFLAMRRAILNIANIADVVGADPRVCPLPKMLTNGKKILVDGNLYIREIDQNLQMPIIKGDGRVACIAAASIFAKVHRDNLMREYAKEFPQYGFEKHKGYGTKAHLEAIEKFGLCEIHRKSFKIQNVPRET